MLDSRGRGQQGGRLVLLALNVAVGVAASVKLDLSAMRVLDP